MKINKFLSFAFLCAAIASSLQFSCDKVKEKLSVNVGLNVAEVTFDLPVFPEASTKKYSEIESISLNLDSIIKAENSKLGTKNIRSVNIKSCQLTLVNPGDKSFGDLLSCKLELAPGNSNDWTTIADIPNNPPTSSTSLTLPVNSDVELKPYFTSNQFKYRIEAAGRKAILTPTKVKAAIKFTMEVGL